MIAIVTTYKPATNTRASYIKATTCNGHKLNFNYDYALNDYDLYKAAAVALVNKEFNQHNDIWQKYDLVGGGTKDGYTFVFVPKTA